MSYYSGGYYAGGYYAGGIFGSIFKTVGGAVGGFLTGGPAGAIRGAIGGAVSATHSNIQEATLSAGDNTSALTPALRAKHNAALARGAVTTAPKPGTSIVPAGTSIPMMMGPGGAATMMRGYRPNKSTYVTRGGGTSRWPVGLAIHPRHTELVKSRRLNVANPRALRRALRRAAGFVKLARRAHVRLTMFTGHGKKKKKK